MKLDKQALLSRLNAPMTQSLFMSMRLKDYYETLADMLEDDSYRGLMNRFREYLRLDPQMHVYRGFSENGTDSYIQPYMDITVGEMLKNAAAIMYSNNTIPSRKLNSRWFKAAKEIIDWTLIKPLIAVYRKNSIVKDNTIEERTDEYDDIRGAETAQPHNI